jgi:signal transduction histidine kinase
MKARTASRLAWSLWAISMLMAVLAFVFLFLGRQTPPPVGTFGFRGFAAIFAVTFGSIGAFLSSRRPSNPIGWIFCAAGIGSALQEAGDQYAIYALLTTHGDLPAGEIAAWPSSWIWIPITGLVTCYVVQLFPTGQSLSPRWRPALYLAGAGIVFPSLGIALLAGPLENFQSVQNPFGIEALTIDFLAGPGVGLYMIAILVSAASLIVRFRRSLGEERQQMKWFVSSAAFVAIALSFSFFTEFGAGPIPLEWYDTVVVLSFLTIPVATGVAILRYRLYDIDVVINKAVTYGVLGAFITVVYGVVVILPAVVIVGSGSFSMFPVVATLIIAFLFQPLRRRAQRFANRLVYGQRATPYEAMADFSHRMAGALSLEEVLPRMAEAAARGIGAQRAGVRVFLPDGDERSAAWPADSSKDSFERIVTITHQGEQVGEISVSKSSGDPIKPAEEKLLEDLASQAGPALHNVRLVEELRASRQRIVAAQDNERRRIERNIHDGAQQQLVALKVKLGLVRRLDDPQKAGDLLTQIESETDEAIDNLRELARGIYPSLLVEQGLEAALRSHSLKSAVPVAVNSDGVGRYSQEVEAAVYFCCLEALQNAAKYARAKLATITLSAEDGYLRFEVADDGSGFDPPTVRRGSGLQNMIDRVQALGGSLNLTSAPRKGTKVIGMLPVETRSDAPNGFGQ